MWTLNPRAYRELAPFGKLAGILFLLLGMTLAFTGMGWFKRRLWGWALAVAVIATQVLGGAVAVIATQVLGGAVNIFMGRIVEGGIGVAIAGALLFYALRADVKSVFQRGGPHTSNVE